MTRIKIPLPAEFAFSTTIPVRITDINYGGHVGNDTILSLLHEVRAQYLKSLGYTELNLDGAGLIMSDVAIEFKNELFYGEEIVAYIVAANFERVSFDFFYKLVKKRPDNTEIVVVNAKTGMVFYDYKIMKVIPLTEAVLTKFTN